MDFSKIPIEMRNAKRWLVWRFAKSRKVPYYVTGVQRGKGFGLDTTEDIERLASFDAALGAFNSGKFSGLGFALGPDGSGNFWQGVDLDDVKANNLLTLAKSLPGYVEYSPSMKGFHAVGYGRHFKTLGSNGSGIEAYAGRRYFTVTGERFAGKICDISGFVINELSKHHHPNTQVYTEDIEYTEDADYTDYTGILRLPRNTQEVTGKGREGGYDSTIETLPKNCKPAGPGTRNRVIFNLARHLKSIDPTAKPESFKQVFKEWHQQYLPLMQTKDFVTSWLDFTNAWEKVRKLEYEGSLSEVENLIDFDIAPPIEIDALGYEGAMWGCVQLCYLLSCESGNNTFFLGCRDTARIFDLSPRTAGLLLNQLVKDHILEIVEKGIRPKATVFRFIWPHSIFVQGDF